MKHAQAEGIFSTSGQVYCAACSPGPSVVAHQGAEATPLPSVQGLLQRTAGSQASASGIIRQAEGTDVELGYFEDEEPSPSMLGEQLLRRPDCCGLSHTISVHKCFRASEVLHKWLRLLGDADASTPHSSRLSSELRPLTSVPLLQHAPAPAASAAAHVDRLTNASIRWLQVQSPAHQE